MTAGIKTLEILDRPGSYEYLDKITSRLINGIMNAAKEAGHAITGGHISGEWLCCFLLLRDWVSSSSSISGIVSTVNGR
jgi:glutamate-1-semialdehyde aminotransferase